MQLKLRLIRLSARRRTETRPQGGEVSMYAPGGTLSE
jgi:hypothetical protein